MEIKLVSPDGKVKIHISASEKSTEICTSHSPEKCEVFEGDHRKAVETISERMWHKGWTNEL